MRFVLSFSLLLLLGASRTSAQCSQGGGTELVFNGDFESGVTGFNSEYINCNTFNCLDEGYYAIGPDPSFFHTAFVGSDHTTGLGNAMIINGAGVANTNVWCQTVSVQPYTSYFFSTWVSTMVASSPAELQFSINGVVLDDPFLAPSGLNDWQQFSATWCAIEDTVATICIVNQNTAFAGNDFALDDISFQPCVFVAPTAISTNAPQCPGETITLSANAGANSYNWLPAAAVACDTCSSTNALPTDSITYTLITTYNGCFDTATIFVDIHPAAIADAGEDTAVCFGQNVQLNAGGGVTYSWNSTATLSSTFVFNPIATVTADETFFVTVTDANGCTAYDSVTVTMLEAAGVDASNDTVVCLGEMITMEAFGGVAYSWSPTDGLSNPNSDQTTLTVYNNTSYTVTVTNADGCFDTASIGVFVFDTTGVTIPSDLAICYGEAFVLQAGGGSNYSWNGPEINCSGCNDLAINATQSGTYTVTFTDANGCDRAGSFNVLVNEGCAQLVFPNSFTPNGDGLNDLFRPYATSVTSVEYHVFDRWGQLLFTSRSLEQGWNGEYNGKPMPVGTYAWYATASTNTGSTLLQKGNLTLMR